MMQKLRSVSLFIAFLSFCQFAYAQQVMLQGWYWDYPKTGQGYNWSDTLRLKATALNQAGFTHVWYPPFAGNGNKSGGYDPKDLFVGPAQTSLGTLGEIKSMISSFTAVGITPVADMVYNHRDAGAPENNPAVKDYITKFASGNSPDCGFKRPFPSDRYRMVIPIGGSAAEGAGTYFIKMRSRGNIFNGAKYAFHATTNKIGGSRWSPVLSPDVDLTTSADQFQYTAQLGRNYLNRIDSNGDQDEFKVTVTASDFNASGDFLIIQAINYDSEYSDHLPIDIFYAPAGGVGSYNIADYTNPFGNGYKLIFQTYTDFNNMPSGRGALNWEGFRPHFTSSSPAGWSQTTCLGPQFSMQSLDYFYDYDHNIPATSNLLIDWTKWAYDELGSKGLRMDAVKHFEPSFVSKMLNEMNATNRNPNLVVGEWYAENADELKGWVDAVTNGLNPQTRNAVPVKVFDFSLRRALKGALDKGENARQIFFSSLKDAKGMSGFNVMTFLNNHDFRSADPSFGDALVHNNPILGYAYILTNNQLGVPGVFYPDYYGYAARNSTFGTDTYGFNYHPTGLKPLKTEIDQLMKVLRTYINNSPGVDYLNHYGGTGNNPPAPNNYIEGSHNRCLLYQLKAPGNTGKEVVVAINFGDTRLRVDHLIAVRNGISQGTRFTDILGKSAFPFAVVDNQSRIYVELPAKSYSVWVQDVAPLSATLAASPVSGTICPGQSATLTTTATGGTAPYTYLFSPGVSQTQIGSVGTATTSGTYSVTVTDAMGLTATGSFTLAVNAGTTITRQPAAQSAVCAGTSVDVSVEATGPGTIGYQWYKRSNNAPLAGQTTSTFSLASPQQADSDGYYCVVTSSCSSLTSTTFELTVSSAPAAPVLTSSDNAVCTPGSLTITSSCPTTTNWSVQGGAGQTVSTGGAINNLYIVSIPSAYTLTATCSTAAGCISITSAPLSVTINQAPAAPVLTASNSGTACFGNSVTLTATAGNGGTLPYTYSFPTTGLSDVNTTAGTALANASGTYSVTVTDGVGCNATSADVSVTIYPLPVATLTPSLTSVCAGQPVTLSASPAGATYRFTGTDTGSQTNSTGLLSFTPTTASGDYSVSVVDARGCVSTNEARATVKVNPLPIATLSAGGSNTLTCTQTSLTLTAGGGVAYAFAGPAITQASEANKAIVTGPGTYSVTVTDGNGCMAMTKTIVYQSDVLPLVIDNIATPLVPQLVNTVVSLSATLSGNSLAGASWKWQWGDNTTTEGILNGNSFVTGHVYATQGVYTPTLTIRDACGQTVSVTHQYVVVYNPEGGFVTGGGWINSPKGAYKPNENLSGKATFGFVAKYKKGNSVPQGNTEFQFKTGDLSFKSVAYEDMRLIIAGAKANFKGTGTINGSGNYGFLISAIDGKINGGGGVDKFRIKIWDLNRSTGHIVYDNNLNGANSGENADPEMAIGGGSIVIHNDNKNGRQSYQPEAALTAEGVLLRNYPNPADGQTTIEFMVPQGGTYSLDIQDTKGSNIRHLQAGNAQAGQLNQVNWEVGKLPAGLYMTQLTTEQGVKVIKVLVR